MASVVGSAVPNAIMPRKARYDGNPSSPYTHASTSVTTDATWNRGAKHSNSA